VRDADFERALARGAKSGALEAQNTAQRTDAGNGDDSHNVQETLQNPQRECVFAGNADGSEYPRQESNNLPGIVERSQDNHDGGAESGALSSDFVASDLDLQRLIAVWPLLPAVLKEGILQWGILPDAIRAGAVAMISTALR
jgi:hypothetical protein